MTINADYEKLLESGYKNIDYELPEDLKKLDLSGNKEKNRETIINYYSKFFPDVNDYEVLIKYLMLRQKERINAIDNNDFLVEIEYDYIGGGYRCTEISIFAPKEKINHYLTNWCMPEDELLIINDDLDESNTTVVDSESVVGDNDTNSESSNRSREYECAEDFENALNNGIDCENAVVTFVVADVSPDSLFGYDLWAGEHLNFIMKEDIGAKAGDKYTVEVEKVETSLGSWIIYCK